MATHASEKKLVDSGHSGSTLWWKNECQLKAGINQSEGSQIAPKIQRSELDVPLAMLQICSLVWQNI